jgi:bifunctional non-homologous end joining protein LigD
MASTGIVEAAAKLRCKSAILDGEVIMQDRRGASDFEALQAALRSKAAPLIFYAFDLLHLDGKDYRDLPLVQRRAKLKHLLGSDPKSDTPRPPPQGVAESMLAGPLPSGR